jgi:HTH-type transcriptional regulator, competence development regulator
MTFGEHLRRLRRAKGLTLRGLASQVGVGFTYLSRVETGTMTYGDYPSEALIHRLAAALDADEDELLLLAEKIPQRIRARVLERPDAFRQLADLDDAALDGVLDQIRTATGEIARQKPKRIRHSR